MIIQSSVVALDRKVSLSKVIICAFLFPIKDLTTRDFYFVSSGDNT